MKNEIKISVIVPIYNVETYVKDCLESIINQPFKDIEIICIDDCSTDNSMVVVESFAKKDSRIKILKHKENRGQSAARNAGMEIASGKYIAFIDSDDTIERDYFINLYEAAEKSGADVTECGYKIVSKNNPVSCHSFHNGIYYNFDNILPRIKKCFVWIRLWRSDFLKKNSLQFYNGIYFEDILFVIQAAYYAKSWNIISYVGYNYRIVPTSSTNDPKKRDKRDNDLFIVLENLYSFAKKVGIIKDNVKNKQDIFYKFLYQNCVSKNKVLDNHCYQTYLKIFGKNPALIKLRRKVFIQRYFRLSLKKKKIVLFGFNLWK